jgi:proteic killer suppression protein
MIKSFNHKALKSLFLTGTSSKIDSSLQRRCITRLDVIDQAETISEMDLPGFDFHMLKGKPKRYSIHVNGPWCITFEWIDGDAWRIDLEQYH